MLLTVQSIQNTLETHRQQLFKLATIYADAYRFTKQRAGERRWQAAEQALKDLKALDFDIQDFLHHTQAFKHKLERLAWPHSQSEPTMQQFFFQARQTHTQAQTFYRYMTQTFDTAISRFFQNEQKKCLSEKQGNLIQAWDMALRREHNDLFTLVKNLKLAA